MEVETMKMNGNSPYKPMNDEEEDHISISSNSVEDDEDHAPLMEGSDEGENVVVINELARQAGTSDEVSPPKSHELDDWQASHNLGDKSKGMYNHPTDLENQYPNGHGGELKIILERQNSSQLGSTTPDQFANIVNNKLDIKNYFAETSLIYKTFADLGMRLKYFLSILFLVFLLLLSGGDLDTSTFLKLTLDEWIEFLAACFGTTAIFNFLGHLMMIALEALWIGDYGFIFCLSSLHSPFVCLSSVIFIASVNSELKLPGNVTTSDRLFTVLFWIILFTGAKRYYVKKSYLQLLEKRLMGKLKEIESWQVILSSLASSKPKAKVSSYPSGDSLSELPGDRASKVSDALSGSSSSSSNSGGKYKHISARNMNTLNQQKTKKARILDAFDEIVKATKVLDSRVDENDSVDDGEDDGDDILQQQLSRRSFWERAQNIKKGTVKIYTTSGVVKLRNKQHAASFAKRLFLHLTKGATKPLTSFIICDAIMDDENLDPSDKQMFVDAITAYFGFSYDNTVEEKTVVKQTVSQRQLILVVQKVFRNNKYAAVSLSDLQALQKSVLSIVDSVFWLMMMIFAQIVLGIDTSSYLAPLLTVLFGFSFAIAPIFSNLFLSLSFVLFLHPFDVGDRVVIAKGASNQLTGNVKSISLFYTTICSNQNERVSLPNHGLFYERIMNLTESPNITFIIQITFTLFGAEACPQAKINSFFSEVKRWATVDRKSEWKDIWVAMSKLDPLENDMRYEIWATHMLAGDQIVQIWRSRDLLMEKIRQLQIDLGIATFTKAVMPVEIGAGSSHEGMGNSSVSSSEGFDSRDVSPTCTGTQHQSAGSAGALLRNILNSSSSLQGADYRDSPKKFK